MTTVNNNRINQPQTTGDTGAITGTSETSGSGQVSADTVTRANELANSIAKELGLPAVNITGADLAVALAAMREKTQDVRMKTATEDIQNTKQQTKTKAQERIKARKEAAEKQAKAEKKKKESQIWGWIGGGAMLAAGVLLCATGVGAAVGTALIVGGVCALAAQAMTTDFNGDGNTMMSDMMKGLGDLYALAYPDASEAAKKQFATLAAAAIVVVVAIVAASACPGPGMVTAMTVLSSFGPLITTPENLEAFGMDAETAQGVSIGITIGLTLATLACGFAAAKSAANAVKLAKSADKVDDAVRVADKAGKAGNVADKAGKAGNVADKAGDAANVYDKADGTVNVVKTSDKANRMRRIGQYSANAAMVVSGGSSVAGGIATIEAGKLEHDATDLRAKVKEFMAWLVEAQGRSDDEKERLQEIMEQLMADFTNVSDIIKDTDRVDRKTVAV